MIDLEHERLVSLNEASKFLPDSRRVDSSTWWRWSRHGVLSVDGARVKLETIRAGGRVATSREAVERFFGRLSGEPAPPPRTSKARAKAIAAAGQALDRAGI